MLKLEQKQNRKGWRKLKKLTQAMLDGMVLRELGAEEPQGKPGSKPNALQKLLAIARGKKPEREVGEEETE